MIWINEIEKWWSLDHHFFMHVFINVYLELFLEESVLWIPSM